jgi:hypothetical protein
MQGTDLSAVARGETTEGPESVLLQIFVPYAQDGITEGWRGIVTPQHTYARYEDRPWVLFDHKEDPMEMRNLAEQPEHTALKQELDAKLQALMKKHGDAWSFNSRELMDDGRLFSTEKAYYSIAEYMQNNPKK